MLAAIILIAVFFFVALIAMVRSAAEDERDEFWTDGEWVNPPKEGSKNDR